MKSLLTFTLILLLILSNSVSGQQSSANWDKWKHLIGEWVGEGNGQPGQGAGSFTFQTDLDGKILVRKNHTMFPETVNAAEKVHDDLLIVYPATQGIQEAIYFDNEGNTIKYKVSFTEKSIVLTSEKSSSAPRFRLSYTTIDDKTVNISFDMASPDAPESFRTYLSGKAFKIKHD
ncbi:MAG: hypothetical protein NTZ85_08675 [Bacteroidia bacterium]|nr:hypothetical protein [Bacteroidia bacterium]